MLCTPLPRCGEPQRSVVVCWAHTSWQDQTRYVLKRGQLAAAFGEQGCDRRITEMDQAIWTVSCARERLTSLGGTGDEALEQVVELVWLRLGVDRAAAPDRARAGRGRLAHLRLELKRVHDAAGAQLVDGEGVELAEEWDLQQRFAISAGTQRRVIRADV
jgi:hypothetical protein